MECFRSVFRTKQSQFSFLARDRYGIKPLYYPLDDEIFCFASEQRAINASGAVKSLSMNL